MISTSDKIQISLFFHDLKARIADRQYGFILNLSAISTGVLIFLFKELIPGNIFIKLSFILFSISLLFSFLLNIIATEFDRRLIQKDEDVISKAFKGDYTETLDKKTRSVGKILNFLYYSVLICFALGILIIISHFLTYNPHVISPKHL